MLRFLVTFSLLLLGSTGRGSAQDVLHLQARADSDYNFFGEIDNLNFNREPIDFATAEFLPGCSWYCGAHVDTLFASSHLAAQGVNTYSPAHAHDFDATTAWVEGAAGHGIGTTLTYEFLIDFTDQLGITTLLIANGYKKSEALWAANGRIKTLNLYLNGEHYAVLSLLDAYEIQTLELPAPLMLPRNERLVLTFEIVAVYPGDRYEDTALSLLMFSGIGVH